MVMLCVVIVIQDSRILHSFLRGHASLFYPAHHVKTEAIYILSGTPGVSHSASYMTPRSACISTVGRSKHGHTPPKQADLYEFSRCPTWSPKVEDD